MFPIRKVTILARNLIVTCLLCYLAWEVSLHWSECPSDHHTV